jgi:flagellar motor switch protein FliM
MSEVLEQNEIDALLNSTEADDPADLAPDGENDASSSLAGGASGQPAPPPLEADSYDFKRPERVSPDQITALSTMHEACARDLVAMFSGLLRTNVDVRVIGVQQLTYGEFVSALSNPTCITVLQAPPLETRMCIEFSPMIVYPFIDRLLGGNNSGTTFIPQRPLTAIEWRLIGKVVDRTLDHLSDAWRKLVEVRFEATQTESNPRLVNVAAPTDIVVFITFEIRLGETVGTMSLCVPFNAIEPVLGGICQRSWICEPRPATDTQQKRLFRNLAKSPVDLTAYLGQTTIRLSDLRDLRPGDLIPLEKQPDNDLILRIAGRNKFAGKIGQVRGRRALRITRRADIDEVL